MNWNLIVFILLIGACQGQYEPQRKHPQNSSGPAPYLVNNRAYHEAVSTEAKQINDLIDRGLVTNAAQVLKNAQQRFPEEPALLVLQGQILIEQGKPREAVGILQPLAKGGYLRATPLALLGLAQARSGQLVESKQLFVDSDLFVKRIYREQGSSLLPSLATSNGLEAAWLIEAGLNKDFTHQGDAAMRFYTEAHTLAPTDALLNMQMGMYHEDCAFVLNQAKKYGEAASHLEKAVKHFGVAVEGSAIASRAKVKLSETRYSLKATLKAAGKQT